MNTETFTNAAGIHHTLAAQTAAAMDSLGLAPSRPISHGAARRDDLARKAADLVRVASGHIVADPVTGLPTEHPVARMLDLLHEVYWQHEDDAEQRYFSAEELLLVAAQIQAEQEDAE